MKKPSAKWTFEQSHTIIVSHVSLKKIVKKPPPPHPSTWLVGAYHSHACRKEALSPYIFTREKGGKTKDEKPKTTSKIPKKKIKLTTTFRMKRGRFGEKPFPIIFRMMAQDRSFLLQALTPFNHAAPSPLVEMHAYHFTSL
jgi:hypothetical protein